MKSQVELYRNKADINFNIDAHAIVLPKQIEDRPGM